MLFRLGNVVATPKALRICNKANINPIELINKHVGGDWGELDEEDTIANVQAIQHDLRIVSKYKVGNEYCYVITEADRSYTTLLEVSEY